MDKNIQQKFANNVMDTRAIFVRRVVETAIFFREMYEEQNDGKTTAIGLLKPIKVVTNTAVRKYVLHDLYKKQKLTLTDVALKFATWSPEGSGLIPPFAIEEIEDDIRTQCGRYEREFQIVENDESKKRRSFLRAARYIQRIEEEGAPAHSRVVELFIPDDFVPQGRGRNGFGHREHVVPCVALLKESRSRFNSGATVDDVADFLVRHVALVYINPDQQKDLDGSCANGGRGVKISMPDGWSFDEGCIFQRLHDAQISFTPPVEFSSCCATFGCDLNGNTEQR